MQVPQLGVVNITSGGVLKTFTTVRHLNYDFYKGMVNIVDVTGSFYFPYLGTITVTQVVTNNVTTVTISIT